MGTLKLKHFTKSLILAKHIGLDSMCFIYHFSQHPLYSPLTKTLFSQMQDKSVTGTTSMMTIAETFVQPEKIDDRMILHEYERFFRSFPNLTVFPIDWYTARLAARLRSEYKNLRIPDAIQLACAILNECQVFITNDKKLKSIKEIRVMVLRDYI